MQIGEAQFYSALRPQARRFSVQQTTFGPSTIRVRAEPEQLSDGRIARQGDRPDRRGASGRVHKYLNFGREHAGLIVTPSAADRGWNSVHDGNDTASRDPSIVTIYGTTMRSQPDNSLGNNENWTVIVANLPYASPDTRYAVGPLVSFPNGISYSSFKIEVVDNKAGHRDGLGEFDSVCGSAAVFRQRAGAVGDDVGGRWRDGTGVASSARIALSK